MPASYNINQDLNNRNKRIRNLVIIVLIVILLVAVFFTASLFRAANTLMNQEGKETNLIASHLMPKFDGITFSPDNSDIKLRGWYFGTKDAFRGNMLFIHNHGDDKLQYDLETVGLINFFLDEGFNVFIFDQRNSGESDGQSSTYGYSEYRDVEAAMAAMYKASGRKDFILYGVGTGTTSALFAWENLPEIISLEEREKASQNDPLLSRQDIIGFILDTPVASAYDYIRADLRDDTFLQKNYYRRYIPEIVRLSSGGPEITNLIPLIGHIDVPIMITRNLPESKLDQTSVDAFITECSRIKAESSYITEIAKPGHLDGFIKDKNKYLEDISYFLSIWY